ncbi:histidine phosphatase family protein [Leifsonia poae]|uniref:Isomerase n=1 Tax=Leifsonia poae TaxID=110933 RepID=A0A9W6HA56_9MICO|nr:histidine phosphatase family protein [Leifsonia poae]GLJ76269.1 isomerase [Leifsonia poae]
MRLLLIRHGQTPDNVRGAIGTIAPGPRLTALGTRQAKALPAALADQRIDALSVSTLVRTQLTARPLAAARGLKPLVIDGLREIQAGDLEGKHDRDSVAIYLKTFLAWASGQLDARMPGAESGHEFFRRYDAAVERAIAADASGDAGRTVAVVSHGAAIRTWVGLRAGNIEADFVREHMLSNTGLVVVDGDPESGWRLLDWESEPVGGEELAEHAVGEDPTGEAF